MKQPNPRRDLNSFAALAGPKSSLVSRVSRFHSTFKEPVPNRVHWAFQCCWVGEGGGGGQAGRGGGVFQGDDRTSWQKLMMHNVKVVRNDNSFARSHLTK